jgi:hypothetical protein
MGITALYLVMTTARQVGDGLAKLGRLILDNLY